MQMKKVLLAALLFSPVALAGCGPTRVVIAAPPPPGEYNEIARQGFNDGWNAARHDIAANRPPNLEQHPKFRHPPVPEGGGRWDDYRRGFREGYNAALRPR